MSNCVRDSKRTREHCLHWPVYDEDETYNVPLYCCRCSLDKADEPMGEHRE